MRTIFSNRLASIGALSALAGFVSVSLPAYLVGKRSVASSQSLLDLPIPETSESGTAHDDAPATTQFQARLSYLTMVSQIASVETLTSEAEAWLVKPQSSQRTFALQALLSRMFEIDPDRALGLAEISGIGPELLQRVFASWASHDSDRALSFLRQIRSPWVEQQLAIAVLQEIGATPTNIERVVAASGSLDTASLGIAYAGRLTETGAIDEALAKALSLPTRDAKRFALERIAQASKNPSGLLSLADSLADRELKQDFLYELYKQWSQEDAETFLQHVASVNARDPIYASVLSGGLLFAAELDPERLLEVAEDLNGPLQLRAASMAFEAMAADDPHAALWRWQSMRDPSQQSMLLESVARGYARADLDEALAWLSTLEADEADVAAAPVLAAVAANDLERAVDLRLQGVGGESFTWLDIPMLSDLENPAALADKVRRSNDDALLSVLVRRWAAAEPYNAVAWMRNQENLPPQTVRNVAQQLAERNIQEAFNLGNSLSEERATWIPAAAAAGAFYDAAATLDALRSFELEPFYDEAVWAGLATVVSRQGGARAAELAGDRPSQEAAMLIGVRWAQESPSEAATWALGLSDSGIRASTVLSVAESWARRDADSAVTWVSGLPDTRLRTEALSRVCRQIEEVGLCD